MTAPQTGTERRQRLKNLREAALHRPVLARHLSNGFNGRWSRRQWVQASLFATLCMLVASIVPGFDVTPVQGLQGTRQSMALRRMTGTGRKRDGGIRPELLPNA